MDAQTFLANFAAIAEAPGGVERLRDLALRLAVSGRLVTQSDDDDPAGSRLTAVRAEKGSTLAGSIRGGGSVPRVPGPEERREELPPGWAWARLDDTGEYINGLAFKNSDWRTTGTPIIRIQNLTNPSAPFNYADGPFPDDRIARDGDILVSWSATLNAFRWTRGDAVVNQHIFKVVPDHRVVTEDYLFHLLRHCIRTMAESEAAHGLVMKHINRGPFLSHVVAVPPLAEQERIVAKVDELTALCDDLDARQQRRRCTATRFRDSVLHALTEAETSDELHYAWERASANWASLTVHVDTADCWRQVIRDLAVTGSFSDPKAVAESERGEFFQGLEDRRRTDGWSLMVPPGWKALVLGDVLVDGLTNGTSPKPAVGQAGVMSLKLSATTRGVFDPTQSKLVDLSPEEAERYWLRPGDLLVQRSNTPQFVGMAALFEGPERSFIFPDLMMRGRIREEVEGPFVHLSLLSSFSRSYIKARASGTSQSMVKINQKAVMEIPIALPPRAEQQRVVGIVDALETSISRLGRGLLTQSSVARALAASATHHQFA